MVKWIAGIVLVLVIAIGLAGYYIYSNLDALVEQAIETHGSEALGVAVGVDGVAIDLMEGRASIYGLSVANPPGYEAPHAFTLGEITVAIDLASLEEQDPIVLDEITIGNPAVFYEMNRAGKANVDVLRENAASGGGAAEESADPSEPAGEPLRLRIRKLRFEEGQIAANTRAIGGPEIDAKIGRAELTDVGGAAGATPDEIGVVIVKQLGGQAADAVKDMGRKELDKVIDDKIGGEEGKAVKGLLDRLGG